MAEANRNSKITTEVVEVEPARPAVYRTEETVVTTYDLTLTQDEADSLATLLHCNVGGLQRSPALTAVLRALEGTGDVDKRAHHLLTKSTERDEHGKLRFPQGLVLEDLFDQDWSKKPKKV